MKRPKSVTWAFVPADWFLQAQAGPLQYQQRATPLAALDVAFGDTCWCLYDGRLAWSIDAAMILHAFACDVAEDALRQHNVTDERSWKAIRVKRQWMVGQASDSELAAAWAAARAAARDAARAAAWDAAWAAAWAAARAAANRRLLRMLRTARHQARKEHRLAVPA